MYTPLWYLPNDRNWTLEELNGEQRKLQIPSMVCTSLLMIIGVTGNLSVLFIFFFKFKPSNHRCFMLTLGIFDTVMCTAGMPFLIVDMVYPFMFTNILACKMLRFMNYYISLVSINVLFLIALERFRKICQPLKPQLPVSLAKKFILIIVIVIGPVLSIPAFKMYGRNTVDTGVNHIKGVQCFTDDSVKYTLFPAVYNLILLFVCCGYATGMGICYIQIIRKRLKTIKSRQKTSKNVLLETLPSSTNNSDVTINATSGLTEVNGNHVTFTLGDTTPPTTDTSTQTNSTDANKQDLNESNKHLRMHRKKIDAKTLFIKRCETTSAKMCNWHERRTNRITKILLLITMIFALSVTPHLLLMVTIFLNANFLNSMGPVTASLYQIAIRSFCINAVANPIIYGCIDKKFRSEFSKIFFRKT